MIGRLRTPLLLSAVMAGGMSLQAGLGLLFQAQYHDAAWIKATWFGNDWVTLVVAVPLLVASLVLARRGSVRGTLLWLGMLGYAAYNYCYYLLGVALNAFFPIYAVVVVLSVATIILALSRIDAAAVAAAFRPKTPKRVVGGYLVFVAAGLTFAWLGQWAAFVFAGTVPTIGAEPFRLVAALDLTIMVTAMATGGILLWRRNAWGYVIAAMAGVQGALYLLVLTANSVVMIARGLAQAPGEVPVWGGLGLATAAAMALLLWNAPGRSRA